MVMEVGVSAPIINAVKVYRPLPGRTRVKCPFSSVMLDSFSSSRTTTCTSASARLLPFSKTVPVRFTVSA